MSTTNPDGISPEDLIAYADGEATPEVRKYIHSTSGAQEAAAAYGRMQRQLQTTLYRFECPSPLLLGEYSLGIVTPENRTRIAMHVIECPLCADELQLLRSFLAVEPLPAVLGPIARLRRLVAVFVPPSLTSSRASVRGPGDGVTRTYRAGDLMISFSLGARMRNGHTTLAGLVWHEGADLESLPGAPVALLVRDEVVQTTAIDDSGGFIFEGVPPGTYRVELTLGSEIVRVEALQIGDR